MSKQLSKTINGRKKQSKEVDDFTCVKKWLIEAALVQRLLFLQCQNDLENPKTSAIVEIVTEMIFLLFFVPPLKKVWPVVPIVRDIL